MIHAEKLPALALSLFVIGLPFREMFLHAARVRFKVSVTNYIVRMDARLTILSVVQASCVSRPFHSLNWSFLGLGPMI